MNFFSRKDLDLVGTPYSEMFQSCYLGLLAEEEVAEPSSTRHSEDAELNIRGGCKVKIHAGPGLVRKGGIPDKEPKFVFDQDLFMPGQVPVNVSVGALQTLHAQAWSIFRGAITSLTHRAMDPTDI